MSEKVEVVKFHLKRFKIESEYLKKLFDINELPLCNTEVEIEIKGIHTAAINALRRVLTDEITGKCLRVPQDGYDMEKSTEPFSIAQFVNQRISLMPLRQQISDNTIKNVRFDLDITNEGNTDMIVYTGDLVTSQGELREIIFNPTFQLAVLQPGKRIVIKGIYISLGKGRDDGAYIVARHAAYKHLDLEQFDKSETHQVGGAAAEQSGYKKSSMLSEPKHHLLTATIPATTSNPNDVKNIFADACDVIIERLRFIVSLASSNVDAAHRIGTQLNIIELSSGLFECELRVPGETNTIGNLIVKYTHVLYPKISYVCHIVPPNQNILILKIRHDGDITKLLMQVANHCIEIFKTIRNNI